MGEEKRLEPKTGQSGKSKFRFLIPDEKEVLRKTEKDTKNLTFDSNVDLTVQFESKGYDTQRYNIKKLVNERLYETQVFDISRISEAIVETINEIEEKGVENFKDLEVVDDYEFENNESYGRSLNILVTEVERKQYTEHVEIDEETFKEQSQIIKNELERILRSNSSESNETYENIADVHDIQEEKVEVHGFSIFLAEDDIIVNETDSFEKSDSYDEEERILEFIPKFENREFENKEFENREFESSNEEVEFLADIPVHEDVSKQGTEQINVGRNNDKMPIKHLNHVYEEVRKPNLSNSVEIVKESNTDVEKHYINFDNDDLDSLKEDDFEKYIETDKVELKLLNDDELDALYERSYLTKEPVKTTKSTSHVKSPTFDEEKRKQASKFFNETEEYYEDVHEKEEIKNKALMYIAIGLISILIVVIVFLTVRIGMNIYESKNIGNDLGFEGQSIDSTIPIVEGSTSDYTAIVEIVSNNSSINVKEITNVGFTYNEDSCNKEYFNDFAYANLRNANYNYITLYGKDDNNHFGSIKYLSDEDFFNTLKINYFEGDKVTEYSAIGYYKASSLNRELENTLEPEDFNKYLSNELALSEHSNGIALTSDSSILSLVTYDTQEDLYHVAYFKAN